MLNLHALWEQVVAGAEPNIATRPFETSAIRVADDAWPELAALLDSYCIRESWLVTDATPKTRGGEPLLDSLRAVLPQATSYIELPAGVHATQTEAEALAARLVGAKVIIALGSGAVTDLCKSARDRLSPHAMLISLPTAASVTAYTSALTVLMVDGVKRTIPAHAPNWVFCDLATLAEAPPLMTRAGFGDVLARSVSYGDWWLAKQCGVAGGYSIVPGIVMGDAEQAMIDAAAAVAQGRTDGVRAVTEALLRAGLAMSVVNATAPLSGWEHVISHWLDMTAVGWSREPALHGEQVGVATLVAARAYEQLWPKVDLGELAGPLDPDIGPRWQAAIDAAFADLPGGQAMAAEAWRDVRRKLDAWQESLPLRREFIAEFDQRIGHLTELVRPSAEVEAALKAAGAATTFEALSQPVSRQAALQAVSHAHLVRARLTLGDLLALGGRLAPEALL